jgi:hypothetical protein
MWLLIPGFHIGIFHTWVLSYMGSFYVSYIWKVSIIWKVSNTGKCAVI